MLPLRAKAGVWRQSQLLFVLSYALYHYLRNSVTTSSPYVAVEDVSRLLPPLLLRSETGGLYIISGFPPELPQVTNRADLCERLNYCFGLCHLELLSCLCSHNEPECNSILPSAVETICKTRHRATIRICLSVVSLDPHT